MLSLSVSLIVFSVSAQEVNQELKPKAGDFGVSILVNGLIDNVNLESFDNQYGQNILLGKYYLKDDFVLRIGFGFDLDYAKRELADSVGTTLVKRDSSFSQYRINIGGGIEKHFSGSKRLDPYVFSQLDLTFIGKSTGKINTSIESKAGTDRTERTIKADGGIGFGLTTGGGFNYFLAPRFSLGTELGLQIFYSSVGGKITDNTVNTPLNGSSTTTFISRDDQTNEAMIDVQPNAIINLSYFF